MSVSVVYWSGSGNTEAMANAVAEGIAAAGGEANLLTVDQASVDTLASEAAFALGCPAMGAEVLEESEMEPFVEELEGKVSGKKVLLFGSYGWGDGEWMRNWADRMKEAGAKIVGGEGLMSHETPDDSVLAECENLGKQLAGM